MSDLAVCVQDDDKNVSPKETIDAIYKAVLKMYLFNIIVGII